MDDVVRDILQRFRNYKSAAETWRTNMSDDIDFGKALKQWTPDQVKVIEARGQAPLVIPIIGPQIELQKSMIISKTPRFTVVGVEDSDNKRAGVFKKLVEFIWHQNQCDMVTDEVVDNQLTCGKGYYYISYDYYGNDGKGSINIESIHPLFVIPDPNSRKRDEEDSIAKFIWRTIDHERAAAIYPEFADHFRTIASTDYGPHYVGSNHSEEDIEILDEVADIREHTVTWIIQLKKIKVKYFRIITDQGEQELTEQQFEAFKQTIATDPNAQDLLQQMQIEEFLKDRIECTHIMGDVQVWQEILPTGRYPLVPVPYEHLGNPYCISLTRKLRGLQIEKNKRRSLMIAHATASTNFKLIVERGSIADKEALEDDWARPSSIIEVNPGSNPPVPVGPAPLPNALYELERIATEDSYYVGGSYPFSHGDTSTAPKTYSATLAIDEYGGRRIGNIARSLYYSLNTLGRITLDFIQGYMKTPQKLRIVNPNEEFASDQQMVAIGMAKPKNSNDETTMYLEDPSVGKFDIYVISGSMAPVNRYAELELYKEYYAQGIIDDIEVLKKTDIFDRDGVIQRKSVYSQMRQQLQGMSEQMKSQQQTIDRLNNQVLQSKIIAQNAQYGAELDKQKVTQQEEYDRKLLDLERAIDELQLAKQQVKQQSAPTRTGKE